MLKSPSATYYILFQVLGHCMLKHWVAQNIRNGQDASLQCLP